MRTVGRSLSRVITLACVAAVVLVSTPLWAVESDAPMPSATSPVRPVLFEPAALAFLDQDASSLTIPALEAPTGPAEVAVESDAAVEEQSTEAPAETVHEEATDSEPETAEISDTEAEPTTEPEATIEPRRLPLPELSPEMTALRDRIRQLRKINYTRPFNTRDNTAGQILQFCLAYGAETNVRHGTRLTEKINGLGSLCYNYPCAGYKLLRAADQGVVARVGYGYQQVPGQFLAILGWSGVPADYTLRLDPATATVADLVESEKRSCRAGTDMSLKLAGLACFVDGDESWKDQLGETWSLDRVIREELDRTVDRGDAQIIHQLMGLSSVVERRLAAQETIDGETTRASEYVTAYQNFAFTAQNSDGSWHPRFFAVQGRSTDYAGSLYANGLILQWLAYSLPQENLDDPRLVRSVSYVTSLLGKLSTRKSLSSMTAKERQGMIYSIRALGVYDSRFFRLWDPVEPVEPIEAATAAAPSARTR